MDSTSQSNTKENKDLAQKSEEKNQQIEEKVEKVALHIFHLFDISIASLKFSKLRAIF